MDVKKRITDVVNEVNPAQIDDATLYDYLLDITAPECEKKEPPE